MDNNTYILTSNGELYHWGVKGMKWGVRRYQNEDGSLTPAGKKRVAQYREKGDQYRGKAYGTGSMSDGTYKPPRDTSDRAFTKNINKSDAYYRKADALERQISSASDKRSVTDKAVATAKKGKRYVENIDGKKVTAIVSATAAVASGALWAASAFLPGVQGITFVRGSLSAISAAMSLADNMAPPPSSKQTGRK